MSDHDDDQVVPKPARNRRRRAVAGAAGLVALLGAGAYLITTQVADRNETTTTRDAGAQAPVVGSASSGSPGLAPGAGPANGVPPSRSMTVDERIKAAREAAAKDGHPVQRALTPAPGVRVASGVVERNEEVKNGSLRIITAHADLTGQRALLWAADKGERHGTATCTQNLRFSNNQKPAKRPNLLLCWRTSATRSVATVLIDYGGHPSAAKSEDIIDREWARLG